MVVVGGGGPSLPVPAFGGPQGSWAEGASFPSQSPSSPGLVCISVSSLCKDTNHWSYHLNSMWQRLEIFD